AGLPEGDERIVRRNLGDQSELQEGPGIDEQLHDQRIPVVPGRRARLRQLHGAQSAELIAPPALRQRKTPERKLRGFCSWECDAPLLFWPAEIQRWQFDLRHLDPDLAEVDVERLVE